MASRILTLRRALTRSLFIQFLLGVLAVVGFYDVAVSQLLPPDITAGWPRAWNVVSTLPFCVWPTLFGLAMGLAGIEYAHSRERLEAHLRGPAPPPPREHHQQDPDNPSGRSQMMTGRAVLQYMEQFSEWGRQYAGLVDHPGNYFATELKHASQLGELRVVGRLNGRDDHKEIPSLFWYSSELDARSVYSHDDLYGRTKPTSINHVSPMLDGVGVYYDTLLFNREDVKRLWPPRTPVAL